MIKKSKNKIFLICTICLSIAVTIAVMLMFKNIRINDKYDKELSEKYFSSAFGDLESKLSIYIKTCQLIGKTEEVLEYASNTDSVNQYNILKIMQTLKKYADVFPDGNGRIALSRTDDSMYITGGEVIEIESFLKSVDLTVDDFKAALKKAENKKNYFTMISDKENNNSFLTFLYRCTPNGSHGLNFVINLDTSYFISGQSTKKDAAFMLVDRDNLTRYGNISVSEKEIEQAISKLNFDNEIVKVLKYKSRLIYSVPSNYVSNVFYVFIDSPSVMKKAVVLLTVVWILLILCCIIFSKKIAAFINKPMNDFKKLLTNEKEPEGWSSIIKSVQKIIDENNNLIKNEENNFSVIKNNFLREALMGILSPEEIESKLSVFNLTWLDNKCLCIILESSSLSNLIGINSGNIDSMPDGNLSSAIKTFLSENLKGIVVVTGNNRLSFITSETDFAEINRLMVQLLDMGETLYNAQVIISVGKIAENFSYINKSYVDAIQTIEQRFWQNDRNVLFSGETASNKTSFYYPIELESSLIYEVLSGKKDKCKELLQNLLKINLYELELDNYNLKELNFAISSTVKRILRQMNKNIGDVFDDGTNIYLELGCASDRGELEKTIYYVFDTLCDNNVMQTNMQQHKLLNSLYEFIEQNFSRDISLSDVAQHCGISQNHINRLLRTNKNTSFKEYIDKVRVSKAKEYLINTEDTVFEISGKTGYNSVKSFIRVFKKYTGVTPGEYRNTQNNNKIK